MHKVLCPKCRTPWTEGFGCTYLWCYNYGIDVGQETVLTDEDREHLNGPPAPPAAFNKRSSGERQVPD